MKRIALLIAVTISFSLGDAIGQSVFDMQASAVQTAPRKKSAKKKKKRPGQRKKSNKRKSKKMSPLQRALQKRKEQNRKRNAAAKKRKNSSKKKKPSSKKSGPKKTRKPAPKKRKKPATRKKPEPKSDIKLSVLGWKNTEKLIAEHKGKIVVVNFWTTWYKPGEKELSSLVRLQKRYPKDVVCISYNLDNDGSEGKSPSALKSSVLKVLEQHKAKIRNVISSDPNKKVSELANLDSVPAVLVYNTQGKLAKRFDTNSLKPGETELTLQKHVVPFVNQLLKK